MKHWLYLLFLLCMLAACQQELPLPASSLSSKITLIGELVANDSVQLRAGQSMPLGTKPELLKNLSVSLQDDAGISTALNERADWKMYELYTLLFSHANNVEAGKKYRVVGKHPDLGEVNASVVIPTAFSVALAEKRFTEYASDSVLSIDIDINDPGAVNAQYVVEVLKRPANITGYFYYNSVRYSIWGYQYLYDSLTNAGVPPTTEFDTSYYGEYSRQEFYVNDPISDNATVANRLYLRAFLTGSRFSGTAHRTQILIPRRFIYGGSGQHAQTTVFVKSIAADYYDFLKAYDVTGGNAEPGGNNFPQGLPSNVSGGLGFVGGVWRSHIDMVY